MPVRAIVRAGHPALARPAQPAPDPDAPEIRALAQDLVDTLAEAGGIGLAAPQIGVGLRVVLYSVPAARVTDLADDAPQPLTVLVNPVLTPIGAAETEDWEGCLSLPGLAGWTPRALRVRLVAETPGGPPIDRVVAGWHARVLQHECDHLDGVLYPRRMRDLSRLVYRDEMLRAALAAAAAEQELNADGRAVS